MYKYLLFLLISYFYSVTIASSYLNLRMELTSERKSTLAYSGGLGYLFLIKWLTDQDMMWQRAVWILGKAVIHNRSKTKHFRAVRCHRTYAIDAREEFAQDFALIVFYKGIPSARTPYPLVSAPFSSADSPRNPVQ